MDDTVDKYFDLHQVLHEAYMQASQGKGKERHSSGESFIHQPICEIARRVGLGYPLGQAVKKIYESCRLDGEAGVAELLGAINYLAAAIIVRREGIEADKLAAENEPERIKPLIDWILKVAGGFVCIYDRNTELGAYCDKCPFTSATLRPFCKKTKNFSK